jgi:hypothetical protein
MPEYVVSIVVLQIVKHHRNEELGIGAFNLQIAAIAYGINKLSRTMAVMHDLTFIRKVLVTSGTRLRSIKTFPFLVAQRQHFLLFAQNS